MSGWIGTLGALSEVLWKVSLSESTPARFAFQQAAGRRWAFLASPTPRRSWSVEVKGTQEDTRALAQLAHAAQAEPLVWVSETAALTNILTPAQSLMVGISNRGPMVTSDGSLAVSSLGGSPRTVAADRVPVMPGKPFTATVEAAGDGAILGVQMFNVAGVAVGATATAVARGANVQRLVVSIPSPPAAAAYATLTLAAGGQFSRLSATWTKDAPPWDVGMGATSVVIGDVETTVEDVHHASGAVWRSVSAKIEEVG